MANSNGTYGTVRPANITENDCDIFYYYRPDRSSESESFTAFKKLNSNNLTNFGYEDNDDIVKLPGMYNLRLPLSEFNETGIYTIYIKPKEIVGNIYDISTLTAFPDIRGIVFDASEFGASDSTIFENGGLVGYRIEYFDASGNREKYYRIITSNNKCEPVQQNLIDTTQTGVSYRFNNSSSLIFCTVTPSTALSFKSSDKPNIGTTGQKVVLINTKFNPVMIEVELTEHDIETVSTMLEGKQIRNLDTATITTFNADDGIYHQAAYGNIVNANTGINHDFKIPMVESVDFNEENKLEEIEKNFNG